MPLFLDQETTEYRKPPAEREIRDLFVSGYLTTPPITFVPVEVESNQTGRPPYDGLLDATWGRDSARFVYEYKAQNTPQIVANAASQASRASIALKARPMVIVPYLSEERLADLETQGVSGIDLCGNALILADKFKLLRSGKPNRFRSSAPIKNVFRGTSSLFARCFLIRPEYDSLNELRTFALERLRAPSIDDIVNTEILSKGTASKVVQALTEDLIVAKEGEGIRLIDPQRLMQSLREHYQPIGGQNVEVSTSLDLDECWFRLQEARSAGTLRSIETGISSSPRYGAFSIEYTKMLYVNDIQKAESVLSARPSSGFPNFVLVQTNSEVPYFDSRLDGHRLFASPLQTWIELATSGPRERDASGALAQAIAEGRSVLWKR